MTTEQIKEKYLKGDVVASEMLRSLIAEGNDISQNQINEILVWSGDDEFVTVKEVLTCQK